MRKLLNTLFVTRPDAYLTKDGLNAVVSAGGQEVFRISIINLEAIITFTYAGVSPGAMKLCVDNGVALSLHAPSGKFIARVQGPTRGNVLLRRAQYRMADDPQRALHTARLMIGAKIQNYRYILTRYIRDYGEQPDVKAAIAALAQHKKHALTATDTTTLMGHEGMASNVYFDCLPHLIVQQRDGFPFDGRNRRPPRDAVNAMLSFAYSLTANSMAAALETVGLDPYVGFLHAMRPGRPSLALDMMEELRAYLGDRFVLSLINRRQIVPTDFMPQGERGILMTEHGRSEFLTAWRRRQTETITHPYLGETIEIGLLPYVQAMMMARYIRGDIDDYPVFLIR